MTDYNTYWPCLYDILDWNNFLFKNSFEKSIALDEYEKSFNIATVTVALLELNVDFYTDKIWRSLDNKGHLNIFPVGYIGKSSRFFFESARCCFIKLLEVTVIFTRKIVAQTFATFLTCKISKIVYKFVYLHINSYTLITHSTGTSSQPPLNFQKTCQSRPGFHYDTPRLPPAHYFEISPPY